MGDARRTQERVQRVVDLQQAAALERRHWVRIGFACNNHCRFCLDASILHDRPFIEVAEVRARIDQGREIGATRLILSGGEASIHPDFVELVRYGKAVGYRRVQTITNGRMFAYGDLLHRAVEAGLGEITFSLHSHRAEVHDRLTGVKGAFAQAVRGLRGALAADVVVSVDIVINRENVATLAETVEWFARMGVSEFDLLHLVPFGRAFDPETRTVDLAVPLEVLQPALARTFEVARRYDLVIWTNRLPAPALEGYEHTIQDPHKLEDEVRGRHEHLQRLVENGTPLPCRDERCGVCYLEHFCDVLHPLQERVAQRALPRLRVSLGERDPLPSLAPYGDVLEQLWIRAPDLKTGLRMGSSGAEEIWELDDWEGLEDAALSAALARRPVRRCVARSLRDLDRLVAQEALGGDRMLLLDAEGLHGLAQRLDRRVDRLPPGLVLGVQLFETLEETAALAVDLTDEALRRMVAEGARLEGLPPCLEGVSPRYDPDDFVDLGSLDAQGRLDPDRYVQRYIAERYRVHSVRCAACVERSACPGLHVNLVRAQGFGVLSPLAERRPL